MTIGWGVFSFLSYSDPQWARLTGTFQVAGFVAGIPAAYLFSWLSQGLDKKLPWTRIASSRFLLGIILHLLLSFLLIVLFWQLCLYYLRPSSFGLLQYRPLLIKAAILSGVISMAYNAAYFGLYSYYRYSREQVEKITLKKEQTQLQLQALKEQLSPHFLFNNLNTISALLAEDRQKAETYVYRLGECYQQALNSNQKPLTTLRKELELLRSYQYLLNTRFESQFQVQTEIHDRAMESKIPPLTLQLLVENAIKHNRMSREKPLEIILKSTGSHLVVSNKKFPLKEPAPSFNIGLSNIISRYRLLASKKVEVQNREEFSVKLPLI